MSKLRLKITFWSKALFVCKFSLEILATVERRQIETTST